MHANLAAAPERFLEMSLPSLNWEMQKSVPGCCRLSVLDKTYILAVFLTGCNMSADACGFELALSLIDPHLRLILLQEQG